MVHALARSLLRICAPSLDTIAPSYVFFQGSQLLVQSHLVCPKRKHPHVSVSWDWGDLKGPCRLRNQLLSSIDDLQDFCGDVAERNSRTLLFGPITEGDRRQEQHINKDTEILLYPGTHHEVKSAKTHIHSYTCAYVHACARAHRHTPLLKG